MGSNKVFKKSPIVPIADHVEPVPEEIVPMALRKSAGSIELFKEEFRAAQRLRSTEGIFIPEVVRTTHPPELAPHGVASNPAPTYVLPPSLQRPISRKALGPGHLNQPYAGPRSPSRGRPFDFSETLLNNPNTEYLLSRQLRPDPLPARPASPPRTGLSPPASPTANPSDIPGGPAGSRPPSALVASIAHRMSSAGRPMTANSRSPPLAGAVGMAAAVTNTIAAGSGTHAALALSLSVPNAPTNSRPATATQHAAAMAAAGLGTGGSGLSGATTLDAVPSSTLSHFFHDGPTQTTITAAGTSPSRPLSPAKGAVTGGGAGVAMQASSLYGFGAGTGDEAGDFIRDVQDDEEGMLGEPGSRPASALPKSRPKVAAGRGAAAAASLASAKSGAAAAGGPLPSTRGTPPPAGGRPMTQQASRPGTKGSPTTAPFNAPQREGFVETVPTDAMATMVGHVRATSASLRRYNLPPAPSAISPVSTTFARKPKAPHKIDPRQPTPSERIANNYSPLARGLSPRTLEAFLPGGIKPGALGPLPPAEWAQVDDPVGELGVPEADGVVTAARKHMAFMPLELFDNLDYEAHEPEEWVELGKEDGGTPAETLMYQVRGDQYAWVPCRVVRWDEEARAFEVEFGDGSRSSDSGRIADSRYSETNGPIANDTGIPASGGLKGKLVKRLNLRFKNENHVLFARRVSEAKAARTEAEAQLRALFYLDALDAGVEEVLATYDFHAALARAAAQVPNLTPHVLEPVGRVLLEDVADYYERAVKSAILAYRRLDPMEEGRLKVLRLPVIKAPAPAPYMALLPVTPPLGGEGDEQEVGHPASGYAPRQHSFPDLVAWSSTHLFMAQPMVLAAAEQLEQVAHAIASQPLWCLGEELPEFKLSITINEFSASEAGPPPFPLERFEALQHSHVRQVIRFINLKLQQALTLTEDPSLQLLLNNGQLYNEAEGGGRGEAHTGLLRLVRMRLADAVHSVLLSSALEYASCLENFQKHAPTAVDPKRAYGSVPESFSSGAFLRVRLEERSIVEARNAEAARKKEEAARKAAALEATLGLDSSSISETKAAAAVEATDAGTQPTPEGETAEGDAAAVGTAEQQVAEGQQQQQQQQEQGPLDPLEELMQGASRLVALVPSPPEIADVAAGMFGEMFDDVATIKDIFVSSPEDPQPLCDFAAWRDDFQLSNSKKRVAAVVVQGIEKALEVASLFDDAAAALEIDLPALLAELEPMNTPLDRYATLIGKIRAAANAVLAAAPTEVWTGLLLVDTAPLKTSLTARADAMIEALLSQLLMKSIQAYEHICVRCETISHEVLQEAADTPGVLELKNKLAAGEAELDGLRTMISSARERDVFRVAYRHEASLDEAFAALTLRAQCWPRDMQDVLSRAWRKVDLEHYKFQDALKLRREALKEDVAEVSASVATYKEVVDASDLAENAHSGRQLQAQLAAMQERANAINEEEGLFGWERSEWPQIGDLVKEVEPYAGLWHVVSEYALKTEDWMYGNMQTLNPEEIDELTTEWYKRMQRLAKSMPLVEHRRLAESTREKLETFKTYVPVINAICNPGMRGRHWDAISKAVGARIWPGEELQLTRVIKAGVLNHMEALQDISDAASREFSLERQLDRMQGEWAGVKFELAPWKATGGFILKGSSVEEAQLLLDDHTIKSQAMQSSPAAAAFLERIETWVKKLSGMQDIFDAWLQAQSKWMYLGPVYGSEEIAKQMPKERNEFQAADAKWKRIMGNVQRQPEILQVTDTEHLLDDLNACNHSFNVIEKSLNAYLDSKKLLFPRFFFLSNDELIEILSEAKDPLNVQPFAKKIFEAVNSFEFNDQVEITAMISIEGERIPFDVPVETAGDFNGVERWLLKVEEMMRKSLATITKNAIQAYPTVPREKWILQWPGQVVIAGGQMYWTRSVTEAITKGGTYGLQQLEAQNTKELMEEVKLVRGDLTSLERATIGALVVIDVHARDVVTEMVSDKVSTQDDFSWQSRLRYYWESGNLLVRMLNAECVYGYEYLGNSTRLVITPLTDRCYRTLLGAHHLNLGGAPAGPAGTGKTETTKDLAKAVAIQCVVFNCSDGLDYIAMGKFFKGLAASGAWACFDEFNRIELEVLSVVAQQVLTIQRAKAAGKKRFTFEGADLPLVHTCNVFITMNPGYAGRSELPDNLKALFRDVAMMVPDYAMIAEIMLYSYGYLDARSLAGKLVQTYRLCSEQLSRQDHYDYGMRAVMAVLRAAGNLKRKLPDTPEDVLMLRAITDVNLPKFLDEDVPLFRGILSDLFPGVSLPEMDYDNIRVALTANAVKQGLQPLPAFLEKAIQLYEMIVVRHGLMLVGWSFGMKTAAIRVLAAALGDMCAAGQGEYRVKYVTLNPKAVTLGQLYGQDDPVSKEWTDGVLAVAFRNAARDTSPDRKWLVLDGPVDAVWIENMNTVLDDNKKLCLNSGEIIAMQGLMNMIFEVQDLAVASPATVSRCGMVYMQPSLLGWRPIVASWMQALPEKTVPQKYKDVMNRMFEALLPPLLRLVTKDCKQPVPMQDINLVQSLVRLYAALLQPMINPPPPPPPGAPPSAEKPIVIVDPQASIECCLLLALIWSVGGTVDAAGRAAFSTRLREFLRGEYGPYAEYVPADLEKLPPMKRQLPQEGSVYDYVYDISGNVWKEWMETVEAQKISPEAEYSQIIVTTMDVVRYTYLLSTLVAAHQPALMIGPTGTGKSAYINAHLTHGLDRKAWVSMVFNFSAQTSANMTQDIIDGKLDKRRKGVYGPPVGKHAVVFVDDLNMPMVEKYGAQPPIELLRQFMDHGGWYDRTDNTFRKLVDVHFLAAMGPPGGGRNHVTNRYLRHFHVLHATEFDDASKTQIFSALVDWWLSRNKFGEEFCVMRGPLVAASLDIYSTVIAELLPTPAKTHYLFNLRDLSKIFQGMSSAGADIMTDTNKLIRLWVHEVLRVFHDRLVDDGDRTWITDLIKSKVESHFRAKPANVFSHLLHPDTKELGPNELRMLLWGDFMVPGAEPQKYDEIEGLGKMTSVVTEYLGEYNSASKKPLNLVLFAFALEHVARLARILKQPGGHALLVGVGGSGRQSLTQLAAFMEDFQVFSVEISASYTTSGPNNNWHDDLKKAIRYAGEKHKPAVFLFSDSQIIEETMVEDISNLLNTGEVPNLFDTGEALAIGEAVRTRAKAARMDGSRADLFAFFVQEVRRYLHVVLCFSPVGDAFRERLRKFPSLVTCTTIDWYTVWPDDALRSVAEQALLPLELGPSVEGALAEQCMRFHKTARQLSDRFKKEMRRFFYVTPTSYLQLLDSFKGLLVRKREEVAAARKRYEVGLDKLASTESQVQGMQAELEALQPQLVASSQETEALMEIITQQTAEADAVKVVVQADEAKASAEAAKVKAIKDECEADLAEALPALNAAIKALDTLTKNDISEVKGMKSPPGPVRLVMEAVCILKGLKPTKVKDVNTGKFVNDYWETSKKMLSDMGFLDSLKSYDKDNIPPEVIEALQPLLAHVDFQPAKIKKVSQAAFGLCSWVRAMDTYNKVAKVVGPKRAKLAEAEVTLAAVMKALAAKQAELAAVEAKLSELGTQLDAAKLKKANLEAEVKLCEEKLDRAQKLIGGLGGEKARWTAAAAELGQLYERLVGDMLLASGMIAYLGAFTAELRAEALAGWTQEMISHTIPCTPSFSFTSALGDPVRQRQWAIWGLPRDDVSAANGIVIAESRRWPLCIDPQGQANKWIRAMEAARKVVVLKPSTDPNYLRTLQASLPVGRPVLLEGLGEALDASLEPVLLRLTFKQSGVLCVKLGDAVVEWSPDFRLYMTTKLRNPHYAPEVCTRVCLLNFCITPTGLEDQLLGVVVAKERPDLEEDKARLIVQGAENARRLKEIEDEILRVLSASEGNILEDGEAVEVLQASKKLSDEIAAKQKDAERTEAAIDKARTAYAPIAAHASVLFFCVAELANIDPMYQYSLAYFFSLFVRSIEDSPRANNVTKRLEVLREHFTYFLYTNVCRSLFEKDKLLFAFSLATSVGVAEGRVQRAQLRFLLTGALSMDNPHPNPAPEWLSDQAWSHLCELDTLAEPFNGLRDSLTSSPSEWRAIYDTTKPPHEQPLPGGYSDKLDSFQRLLVLRCILPDKLIPAIQAYVADALGRRYVEPQAFRLEQVFNDSAAAVPLIFVLSFGSDPMADLLKFADERHKQVETVSLGQGQGPIAERMIDAGVKEGFWVVLQNCHLAKSFLPRLEVLCEKTLGGEGPSGPVNPEFRLWLTSYPSPDFPQAILENGLKITNEPPKGLRAGLERIYRSDPLTDPEFFDGFVDAMPRADGPFKNLLLGLAFFHCVVVGRRLYGPVGWNIPYTFNENDLRISLRQLRMFVSEATAAGSEIPLAMLTYTAGECNYGGKVTDAKDRRTLMVLLERFYNEEVVLGGADLATPAWAGSHGPPHGGPAAGQGEGTEGGNTSGASEYVCPEPGEHAQYLSWLSHLPLNEAPQVFGLHPNALVTRDLQDTRLMLDSLLLTQSQDSGAGGGPGGRSPEEIVGAAAAEILDKLPPDFDLEAAQAKYPVTYLESMNTVLVQELGRANVLLQIIRSSLMELTKAVRGLVVMSSSLEKVAGSLLNGKVPELWLARSFPSLKPLGPYVREVVERVEFFADWLAHGPPTVFWLSGFFFTQAFLTGAKQNYARKHKVPIDLIDFDFEVRDQPGQCDRRPEDGVLVRGMFLEAAAWDPTNHVLCESAPKVLFVPIPPMLFLPAKLTEFKDTPHYMCPMYKTSERRGVLSTTGHSTNFVCDIRLPSNEPQSHWVMRGCAALTSLDS